MKYVDGYVLTIKKENLEKYKNMAQEAAKSWKKHGALEYMECVGEDMNPEVPEAPEGEKMLTFPELTKVNEDETIIFAFITYKSREHRDEVNKKVYEEMMVYIKENPNHMKDMPFDMKKMVYGGFKAIVEE